MRKLLIAAIIGSFCTSAVLAQTSPSTTTNPPPATTTNPPPTTAKTKKAASQPRTPESLECSKQADAQGLKGKPRKTFRAKCKKDLLKKKT